MASPITRRRAICIMAAAAGLPLLDLRGRAEAAVAAVTWRGRALGAPATLILNLESQADAAGLVDRVVAEVARLERVFSLYQRDSALAELNRTGAIAAPPPDLVNLLEASRGFWETTGGPSTLASSLCGRSMPSTLPPATPIPRGRPRPQRGAHCRASASTSLSSTAIASYSPDREWR